jgi:DNA-binding PadR family transcriptional regulator
MTVSSSWVGSTICPGPHFGAKIILVHIVELRYSQNPTMKDTPKTPHPLSTATLYILLALASEDLHGYGIIQEIARQSHGSYRLGPGTLYDNLKKLMDQKLVVDAPRSARAKDDDRRFYRLTPAGRAVLTSEIERLQSVVLTAQLRLRERKPHSV